MGFPRLPSFPPLALELVVRFLDIYVRIKISGLPAIPSSAEIYLPFPLLGIITLVEKVLTTV
jgi:hypothetical protein